MYEVDLLPLVSVRSMRRVLFWYRELGLLLSVPGSIVEFGVWRGSTLGLLATLDEVLGPVRGVVGFDTFTGFPRDMSGSGYRAEREGAGLFRDGGIDVVRGLLRSQIEARSVVGFHLVEGDIFDTLPVFLAGNPDRVAVCVMDVDVGETTRFALEHIWPRMSPGGRVYLDEYSFAGHTETIGVDGFVATLPGVRVQRTDVSHPSAFIQVPYGQAS